MNRNTIAWAVVSCMLVVMLAACSGSNGNNTPEPAAATQPSSPDDASASGSAAESASENTGNEVVEINFLSAKVEEQIMPVIQAFEADNPDIKINYEFTPFANYFEKVEVVMGAQSSDVDVLDVDITATSSYVIRGFVEPIEDYLSPGVKEQWVPKLVEGHSYDGKLVSAPLHNGSQVLYYNKALFDERGIPHLSPNVEDRITWEQLVEMAKQLTYDTNGDGRPDVFGFSFDQISRAYQTLPLAFSLGAQPISDDGLTASGFTNSPKMAEAAQFYYDLFNTWEISPKIGFPESREYFNTGKVAMFIASPQLVIPFTNAGVDFGIAPFPYFEGQTIATPTGAWALGLAKNSTKKEAGIRFIEYATTGKGSQIWIESSNNLSALVAEVDRIIDDPAYDEFPAVALKLSAYESRNTAVNRPPSPGFLEWESRFTRAYEDIKNGADPKTALDEAAAEMDRLLGRYK